MCAKWRYIQCQVDVNELKMGAFVFILLALGCSHTSEAKEQLSLTDLLLDFLLSLWAPPNYVPSNSVRRIPDPTLREQMMSMEKSRTALNNYIRHLLRYAQENTYNPYNDELNQISQPDDQTLDSSTNQVIKQDFTPLCNQPTYNCDYPSYDPNEEFYPSQGIGTNNAIGPNQGLYPNQAQPNQGRLIYPKYIPDSEIISEPALPLTNQQTGFSQGMPDLEQKHLHPGHYHPNEFHLSHFHQGQLRPAYYHPTQVHAHGLPPTRDNNFLRDPNQDQDVNSTPDAFLALFPGLASFMRPVDGDPNCDPDINPVIFFSANLCLPLEMYSQYLYEEIKRNADPDVLLDDFPERKRIFGSDFQTGSYPAWYKNPPNELARRIAYLSHDKDNHPKGIINSRILRDFGLKYAKLPEDERFQRPSLVSARNIKFHKDFEKLDEESQLDAADTKTKTRTFEERFLTNYIDGWRRHSNIQRIVPAPSAPDYHFWSRYFHDRLNEYDSSLGNQTEEKKLSPEGSLSRNLNVRSLKNQLQKEKVTDSTSHNSEDEPMSSEETSSTVKDIKSGEKNVFLPRALVAPADKKETA